MPRGRNDADAAHESAAVGAWEGGANCDGRRILAGADLRLDRMFGGGSEPMTEREQLLAVAPGQEAIMADAVKAVREDMQQKAANELVGREAHDPTAPLAAIVLVRESDVVVAGCDQPRIGDRCAVSVAREIGEHLLGTAERRLGVDDPIRLAQRNDALGESAWFAERRQLAEKAKLAFVERRLQGGEEQSTEQARQRLHRQEEAWLANDPALAAQRDSAARDDAMDMGMMGERLAPGVENREQANPGAETLRICGERHGRLGGGAHQRGIEKPLVLEGDLGRRRRQGEDEMEIRRREQLGLARVEPGGSGGSLAFWAMPVAAGVVGDTS